MGVDNISPWYISLNNRGQVPTLVHEGKTIPDLLAIAKYLDTTFGKSPIFYADNSQVLKTVEKWRQVKESIDQDVSNMDKTLSDSRQHVSNYMKENPQLLEEYKTRLAIHNDRAQILVDLLQKERLETLLQETEFNLKKNNGHLLQGKNRTVADIYFTGILYWLTSKLDKDNLLNSPMLHTYYKEKTTRPSFIRAFK